MTDEQHILTSASWSVYFLACKTLHGEYLLWRPACYIYITSQTCKWVHATIKTFNNRSYCPHTAQLTQNPIKNGLGDKLRYLISSIQPRFGFLWFAFCIGHSRRHYRKIAATSWSNNFLVDQQNKDFFVSAVSGIKKASSSLGHWVCV